MIEEVAIKTHLIVTDIHEEYTIKWTGKIIEANPLLKDGKPIFVIISSNKRMELNTINMKQIEDCAKSITSPHGRQSTTSDISRIYIKEVDGNERYLGSVVHKHIKQYAPMYDKVGYR